jgi:hypothetical protein
VFRFTLGIPGFDDSNIPRVIGTVVAALVALNHAIGFGNNPAPPAQVRCVGPAAGGAAAAAEAAAVVHALAAPGAATAWHYTTAYTAPAAGSRPDCNWSLWCGALSMMYRMYCWPSGS